jgi:hypothetical protein
MGRRSQPAIEEQNRKSPSTWLWSKDLHVKEVVFRRVVYEGILVASSAGRRNHPTAFQHRGVVVCRTPVCFLVSYFGFEPFDGRSWPCWTIDIEILATTTTTTTSSLAVASVPCTLYQLIIITMTNGLSLSRLSELACSSLVERSLASSTNRG